MKKKKAFTLIELLVVIAIIALLLAILMPSLKKVKQIARDVVCRSNLKQWSLIWAMYTNEHDGKFPYSTRGWPRGEWVTALRNEWQTEGDIIRCPSATKDATGAYGNVNTSYDMGTTSGTTIQENCSYGMNCWAYSKPDRLPAPTTHANKYWRTINAARGANNIPVFMDSKWRGAVPGYESGLDLMTPTAEVDSLVHYEYGMGHFAMPRHGKGAKAGINVMFMDLSARHVRIKQLWTLKWHREFNTSGYTNNGGTWPAWMDKYENP